MGIRWHTICRAIILFPAWIVHLVAARDINVAVLPVSSLESRQTNATDLVDPVTMPYCLVSECWHWNAPPPELCPLVIGPCANNSDASDNGGSKCGIHQYERDCYCSLKTGLYCAWSCSWTIWWETEDWYATICPKSTAITMDFSELPKCARGCLDDAAFQYGCLTESSNCFCSHGDLFGCHDKCNSQGEWQQIETWLRNTCNISSATAAQALKDGTFALDTVVNASTNNTKGLSPPPSAPRKPLSWDEDFIIAVLAFTVIAGIGIWGYSCFGRRK
ncbi:uncharacterized protein PAC_16710 [Phialocephala subalpina]|uniref:Extracellular membrane protein CFEM domain-containing protein n=1 Tax=Phialocephala subalpina TaxID=576137 RepID=A0A1L7XP47_9HELO|nr:uncharacterized protein PAC_16710 [Phialocephala subalpina]